MRLLPPVVLNLDGMRAYVGEVDGEVVTTALGMTRADNVGIFNVATPPEHRRRGYGAAVTARAAADGFAAGATWAWLQSSTAGYHVYEAIGFRTLERWLCWVRA
jgi:predicted GNAT family acetyltransferase